MPSMYDRIREDLTLKEQALWTALTSADPGPAVEKLTNPEGVLMFPQMPEILSMKDKDRFREAMAPPFHRFDGYQFDDVKVIIIDLMAGAVTYKIRAVRGKREYRATCSSTWGQGSDGEWTLFSHSETLQ
ncbi:Uncharacterized protein PECH_006450 [Penicillium ucsense]|uniref:DUF4440 domain-containing protein n=2 Tax=Penicillium TaxID=5073 RepID=A0A8J8W6N4_9EURO|nr:uncharacterized protein N7539_006046 [Penicillium diatomitis]KAF7717404.1 Uncharacterized protein PECM_004222 [Penicillium ucsense]KAF7735643.1 Uncharacterized protein PECH_006450 [Penicillium ucsense]KAJ5483846.1 hypothetical protein N7539_006046 [Penicillium diatomitis]